MRIADRSAKMSKEVAGEPEGVTLSECIADGRVPVPDRMSFPKWQAWRKDEGKRPVKKRDGRGVRTADEVALWKATMDELYGMGSDDEEGEEEEEGEDGPSTPEPGAAAQSSALALRSPVAGPGGLV